MQLHYAEQMLAEEQYRRPQRAHRAQGIEWRDPRRARGGIEIGKKNFVCWRERELAWPALAPRLPDEQCADGGPGAGCRTDPSACRCVGRKQPQLRLQQPGA